MADPDPTDRFVQTIDRLLAERRDVDRRIVEAVTLFGAATATGTAARVNAERAAAPAPPPPPPVPAPALELPAPPRRRGRPPKPRPAADPLPRVGVTTARIPGAAGGINPRQTSLQELLDDPGKAAELDKALTVDVDGGDGRDDPPPPSDVRLWRCPACFSEFGMRGTDRMPGRCKRCGRMGLTFTRVKEAARA